MHHTQCSKVLQVEKHTRMQSIGVAGAPAMRSGSQSLQHSWCVAVNSCSAKKRCAQVVLRQVYPIRHPINAAAHAVLLLVELDWQAQPVLPRSSIESHRWAAIAPPRA